MGSVKFEDVADEMEVLVLDEARNQLFMKIAALRNALVRSRMEADKAFLDYDASQSLEDYEEALEHERNCMLLEAEITSLELRDMRLRYMMAKCRLMEE